MRTYLSDLQVQHAAAALHLTSPEKKVVKNTIRLLLKFIPSQIAERDLPHCVSGPELEVEFQPQLVRSVCSSVGSVCVLRCAQCASAASRNSQKIPKIERSA